MPTPISNTNPYCSTTQFLDHYDARPVGDYLSDTTSRLSRDEIIASTVLLKLLKKSSGLIESALMAGGRYTPEDLLALTGDSLAYLEGLTADLTMWMVLNRRPNRVGEIPKQCQMAIDMLERLRGGERILGLQAQIAAGETVDNAIPPDTLLTVRGSRFFGDLTTKTQLN